MLLRSLALRNIRSYNDGEETRLDLPEGIILFRGGHRLREVNPPVCT